jgi:hypothetical protein
MPDVAANLIFYINAHRPSPGPPPRTGAFLTTNIKLSRKRRVAFIWPYFLTFVLFIELF